MLAVHLERPLLVEAQLAEQTVYGLVRGLGRDLDAVGAPALELDEGDCDPSSLEDGDFDIDDAPPGVARLEETLSLPLTLVEDSWVVVVVSGTDGDCEPMFPVYAADLDDEFNLTLADLLDGNLDEGGVMALGFTNALFVDLGGDGWKGPLEP